MTSNGHFTVATWNVHRCVGADRRCDPDRVAAVIASLGCDVVALQEVDCLVHDADGFDQLEHLAMHAGAMHLVAGPTLRRQSVTTGNAILSRHPVLAKRWVDLTVARREPRGALDVDLDVGGRLVRVVSTHMGLQLRERDQQVERLLAALTPGPEEALVVLGDFNEWYPRGRLLRRLSEAFACAGSAATFPAWRPFLALDRVWVKPRGHIVRSDVVTDPEARRASDHLPLRATLDLTKTAER